MTGQNLFRKRASLDSKDAQRPRRSRCLRTSEVLRLQQTMMFSRTVVDHDPRVPADAVASCRRVAPSVARGRRIETSRACSTDSLDAYTYYGSNQASSRVRTENEADSEPCYFRDRMVEMVRVMARQCLTPPWSRCDGKVALNQSNGLFAGTMAGLERR